jgi:pimeloyl-ACP methyl ester carboxylesterase
MPVSFLRSAVVVLLLSLCNSFGFATTVRDSIPAGKNFDKAQFELWYPDKAKTVSGIIILMPGSNEDGRSWANDPFWQALATRHQLALLACYFTDAPHPEMNIEYYADVKHGSGQALLDVISRFAKHTGLSGLATAPLLLWGHSAGGEFNYEFACWKPERVMAFVVNKGGFYYTGLAPAATRQVPGLFLIGEKDMESRNDIIKGLFMMNRRVGALWTFGSAPGAEHEIGTTQRLAGNYFSEIINLKNSGKWPVPGVIGDFKAQTIAPVAAYKGNQFTASWLPTEMFANAWLMFITGNL